MSDDFARDGFVGPFPLLTQAECRRLADYLRRTDLPKPEAWAKGRAVRERALYDIAVHPELLRRLEDVLGGDIVLWGVSAVRRTPGQSHPWHSDIESYAPDARFASVWIGIENTTPENALRFASGTHLLGHSVQEARAQLELTRDAATTDELLAAARESYAAAELVAPTMSNGDAVLFDGRIWHGS